MRDPRLSGESPTEYQEEGRKEGPPEMARFARKTIYAYALVSIATAIATVTGVVWFFVEYFRMLDSI